MRQKLLLVTLLCGALSTMYGFEVQIAEFQSISDSGQVKALDSVKFSKDVFSGLTVQDQHGLIGFKYRDSNSTNGLIKSQMDAVKNCEIFGWEVLVYGQIIAKEYGYDIEIKIYSHPDRQVIRTFLLRSAAADSELLVTDCATKVFSYFSNLLQVDVEKKPFIAEGNSLVTSHTIEWWGTIPPWIDTVTSIAGYHGTLGFRLGTPLWTNGEWAWVQEFGLGLGLHYGLNNAQVIDSNLYDIDIGPNVSWAFVWQRQQEIRLSIEPNAKIHLLNYQPLYETSQWNAWTWYGIQLNLEYRFWLNSQRTFGMGLQAGASSYLTNPLYIDYRIGVDFAWKGLLK